MCRITDAASDDGPRLRYADWLDENGQPERAEFIRLQCAAAGLVRERKRLVGNSTLGFCARYLTRGLGRRLDEWQRLFDDVSNKARNLLSAFAMQWLDDDTSRKLNIKRPTFFGPQPCFEPDQFYADIKDQFGCQHQVIWQRGFIAMLRCGTEGFLRMAGPLFAAHPVQHVFLTDRQPAQTVNSRNLKFQAAWYRGHWPFYRRNEFLRLTSIGRTYADARIPDEIFDELVVMSPFGRSGIGRLGSQVTELYHHNRRASVANRKAWDALSAACCNYGRQQAALNGGERVSN